MRFHSETRVSAPMPMTTVRYMLFSTPSTEAMTTAAPWCVSME